MSPQTPDTGVYVLRQITSLYTLITSVPKTCLHKIICVLALCSHLCLVFVIGFFPSAAPTKILFRYIHIGSYLFKYLLFHHACYTIHLLCRYLFNHHNIIL
jgi:hypothetical protein